MSKMSHIDETGAARMVNISDKPVTARSAKASCIINMHEDTVKQVKEGLIKKGDVLAAARIAGISAAKKTSDLVPLCHNIEIDSVSVDFEILDEGIKIFSTACCTNKTGIEMEALTAVMISALTIYDMCKAVDKKMTIDNVILIEKKKTPLSIDNKER